MGLATDGCPFVDTEWFHDVVFERGPQVISRKALLCDQLDPEFSSSSEDTPLAPMGEHAMHGLPAGASGDAPLLVPLMAHALDQASSSDEGQDVSDLFEDNFGRTFNYDDEWIRELDAALGQEPLVELAPTEQCYAWLGRACS